MTEVPCPDMLTPMEVWKNKWAGSVWERCTVFRGTVNFTLEQGIVTLIQMEVTAVEIPIFRGPLQLEKIDN